MQNESGGLQLKHKGKWLNANLNPNWIIVNLADHLEVLTNGKYKSTIHRVIVNNEIRRVTCPLFMGPSLEAFVSPALEFVDDDHPPAYRGMSYKDYLEANQFHIIEGKSCLKQIRL
ncbi:protein DMR6-LIKE OXYGENASE 2-like [Herrania umbratica]|uniref:Protein DMR6-LIKE OXYGENASE 2-like n=1 Tax=Herrania umbratica TaxID=108875 RepID=A0A6J1B971_9ROSI|nr:protein DMR6-LIKE OXYGENASE 2-like [Herrania umbratica]